MIAIASERLAPAPMEQETERLQQYIAEELRRVGVDVTEERLAAMSERILDEAVRLSLRWVEGE